jgi:hypothetical protein
MDRTVIEADLNVYFTLELDEAGDQDMRLDFILDSIRELLEDELCATDVEVDIAAVGPLYA